jgi:hypothetical protein
MFVQRILPTILVIIPAAIVATVHGGRSEPAVDQCKTKPGLSAAQGTHWYYRLDHVTKRQCWYLGLASGGRHANANAPEVSAAAPTIPVPPQKPAAVQTAQALQRQAAETTPPQLASAAAVSLVELQVRNEQDVADFAARWANLPLTDISSVKFAKENQIGAGPSRLSSSYAEQSTDEDALPDVPLTWPVVEAATARPDTSIAAAVQPLYLAGGAVMALLFLAGWSFGQVRGRRIHIAPATMADAPIAAKAKGVQSRSGDHANTIESSLVVKTHLAVRSRPTPTDPALDLKKSLGELMRDLQRAGVAAEARPLPVRGPKRRAAAVQNVRPLETVD